MRSRSCPEAAISRWCAVKNVGELSPWCLARLAESLPEGTTSSPRANPARRRWLAARPAPVRTYGPRRKTRARPARAVTGEPRGSMTRCGLPKRPRWSATSSTRPPPIWVPPSSKQRRATLAKRLGRAVRVTAGKELAEGYPLIAAVGGAATDERAPRLIELEWGKPRPSAHRDRRQGRLLRQRRSRSQAGVGHADDEEGHGRCSPRACPCPIDHREPPSGSPSSAHPSRRECRLRRRLSSGRHRQVTKGPVRRDRQHRRRRAADPG